MTWQQGCSRRGEKGVEIRTQVARGGHRRRQQGREAGSKGRRHEGVMWLTVLWERREKRESEVTPTLQLECLNKTKGGSGGGAGFSGESAGNVECTLRCVE